MFKLERETISERRLLFQNPYAYIEHLEGVEPEQDDQEQAVASKADISRSRELFENPYAHLDGAGNFSALPNPSPHRDSAYAFDSKKVSYTDNDIEVKVKEIHEMIWRDRGSIWIGAVPPDPVDMLDPAVALRLIGYNYQLDDGLGQYRGAGGLLEVAGLIDRASKIVRISSQFPSSVRTFTTAHELGHAVLHRSHGGVHRDRPMNGATLSREISEVEADKFATFYLMPAKLVRSRFAEIFKEKVFFLNEDTSFALAGVSHSELRKKCKTRRDLSRLLASAERYDGRHFPSLAAQFHVSTETMAIRIEELGLLMF